MKDGKHIDEFGDERWFKNDEYHRYDGPAVTLTDGTKYWFQNGKRHRDSGPAIVFEDGEEYWYQNGKMHRDDGPAIIYPYGAERWFRNGAILTESEILLLKEKISFNNMMKDLLSSGDSI